MAKIKAANAVFILFINNLKNIILFYLLLFCAIIYLRMKRKIFIYNKIIISLAIFCILILGLIGCSKDDYHDSDQVLEHYINLLNDEGYIVTKIDANNNVAAWLEINDKDVVAIYKAFKENQTESFYLFLFPTLKKANKWYKRIEPVIESSNYFSKQDGHYIIVGLGNNLYNIVID